jgi:dienelactone hydrolase
MTDHAAQEAGSTGREPDEAGAGAAGLDDAEPAAAGPDPGATVQARQQAAERAPGVLPWLGGSWVVLAVTSAGGDAATGAGASAFNAMNLVVAPLLGAVAVTLLVGGTHDVRSGNPARGGALLLVLLAFGLWVLSGSFARGMIFPGHPLALPPGGTDLGGGASVLAYTTDDGVELRGVLARPRSVDGPLPAAVYFHGNAESAAQSVDFARALAAEGLVVLIAEYRGYAGCAGSPSQAGLVRDGRAAISALSAESGVAADQVLLIGRSLGTGVASLMAAEGFGQAIVLVSPYSSVRSVAGRIAPRPLVWLGLRDPFDSQAALATRPELPAVIFHGTADRVIPCAEGQALAASLGERASLHTLEGVGHDDILWALGGRFPAEVKRLAASGGPAPR